MSKVHSFVNKLNPSATVLALTLAAITHAGIAATQAANVGNTVATSVQQAQQTRHKTLTVNGVEVFYRQAGPSDAPTILLLHGFPTSSHMFRNLIPALADKYHVVAPDYPGFGNAGGRRAGHRHTNPRVPAIHAGVSLIPPAGSGLIA